MLVAKLSAPGGFAVVLLCSGIASGGCSKAAAPESVAKDSAVAAPAAPARPAAPTGNFTGVIRGIVKLAEGAVVPLGPDPKSSPMVGQPLEPCSRISDADRRVVFTAESTRGLTPIHVAVTGMKSIPPSTPTTHVVRALDCRLQPDLVGAQVGDTVQFENNSAAVLPTALPGDSFIRTLAIGEKFDVKITGTGVFPALCPIGTFCGATRIVAVAHPLWAVTDQAGTFRIEHVPLDEPVVVHAWHPLFAENNVTITLDKSAPEREITLVLTPMPQAPEPSTKAPGSAAPASRTKQQKPVKN